MRYFYYSIFISLTIMTCASGLCQASNESNYLPKSIQIWLLRGDGQVSILPTPTPFPDEIVIDLPGLPQDATPLIMVLIPQGRFMMGAYPNEQDSNPEESPQEEVNLNYNYYMGKYEVTKAQWEAVMGTRPWDGVGTSIDDPNSPAIFVSCDDAHEFIDALNRIEEGPFGLPTGAEWEYACRAGTKTRFYWGDDLDYTQIGHYAWYNENALAVGKSYAHQVGLKLPNAWDLYDMSGNVAEWIQGRYFPNISRTIRGGDWTFLSSACRSASWRYSSGKGHNIGFRIVRANPTPTPTITLTPTDTQTMTPTVTATPTKTNTPVDEIIIQLPGLTENATPLVLGRVSAGNFEMGRYYGESGSDGSEDPQHPVTIGYDFYMGKFEITKAQWEAVMGTTPWDEETYIQNDPNSAAVYVSWNDAQAFLDVLNQLGQGPFRLPSEAEWEYACRAGSTTRFYWENDTDIHNYAWYYWNVRYWQKYAQIVGQKLSNAWGFHDMSGNVWEYCQDTYHPDYNSAPTDGRAWEIPVSSYRVMRGGGWRSYSADCRNAVRHSISDDSSNSDIGFRVVQAYPTLTPKYSYTVTPTLTETPTFTPTPTYTVTITPTPTNTPWPGWTPGQPIEEISIDLPGGATMEMVLIPSGKFMMGRSPGDNSSHDNDLPRHEVSINYHFYMGKFEVTQAQWESVMNTSPYSSYRYVLDHPNCPAVTMPWITIKEFIEELNQLGQGHFRLPTEAEWEHASRAGTTTRFYWGDDSNEEYSKINQYAWYVMNARRVDERYAHKVGQKLQNAWGLYDMSGNVWEWCQDGYHDSYENAPTDGSAWESLTENKRVYRGGSFEESFSRCRCSERNSAYETTAGYYDIGFRVVRDY